MPQESHEWLQSALEEKQGRRPKFSMRAFARELKVSPTYLSLLLNGKRKLSIVRAVEIAEILNWTGPQRDSFLLSVALSHVPPEVKLYVEANIDPARATQSRRRRRFDELSADKFQFFSSWECIALLDLISTKDFRPETAWIARRLGLSSEKVDETVQSLLKLKALTILPTGKWKKASFNLELASEHSDSALRNFYINAQLKLVQVMRSPNAAATFKNRSVTGTVFGIDRSKVPLARDLIRKFEDDMIELLSSGEADEVYYLGTSLFPLTEGNDHV